MRQIEVDHQAIAILHAGSVESDLFYLQKAIGMARPLGSVAAQNLWLPEDTLGVELTDVGAEINVQPLMGDAARPLAMAAFQRFRQIPDTLSIRERHIQQRMNGTTDLRPLFRMPGAVALVEGRLPAVNDAIKRYDRMVTFDDALRAGHAHIQV